MRARFPLPSPSTPRRGLLPLLALLAAGCGAKPTGVEPDAAVAVVTPGHLVLTEPSQRGAFTVQVGNEAVRPVSLSLAAETRVVPDAPVLDPHALALGEVRAAGPGTAVVRISHGAAAPAHLEVVVAPDRPLVTGSALVPGGAAGDTLVLRGFDLRRLSEGTVRIGARPVHVVARDSTRMVGVVAGEAPGTCISAAEALAIDGAYLAPGAALTTLAPGALSLEAGESRRLSAAEAACLRLAAYPGARYALAFADVRGAMRARTGYEGGAPDPAHVVVEVGEVGNDSGPAAARPGWSALPDAHRHPAAATAPTGPVNPFVRAEPWRTGERIQVPNPAATALLDAVVIREYPGGIVLAVADGAVPQGERAGWEARADSAFGFFAAEGAALLDGALGAARPLTSAGSGQLLVVAYRDEAGYLGVAAAETRDGERRAYLYLAAQADRSAASLLRALAHEAAHAWQEQYAWRTRPAGSPYGLAAAVWGVEGGADLLSYLVVARYLGVGLLENWDWAAALVDPARAPLAVLPAANRGAVSGGYAAAAAFLLDQVERLVRAGVRADDAVAAVSRGAVEGWFGHDARGAVRTGLAERMRAALGGAWNPADALLRWTVSQALDDLTHHPELQNGTFLRANGSSAASSVGWQAPAVLRSGGDARAVGAGIPVVVRRNSATLTLRHGSASFLLIEDDGSGGAYRLSARSGTERLDEGVAWMLTRYR